MKGAWVPLALAIVLLAGCVEPDNETAGGAPGSTDETQPTAEPTTEPTASATPDATPSPTPTPSPTASPSPSPTPTPDAGETHTVEIGGNTQGNLADYAPSERTIKKGDSVVWENLDASAPHTATARSGAPEAFDTGRIDPGETSDAIVFDTAGTYTYYCKFHSAMPEATIVVEE